VGFARIVQVPSHIVDSLTEVESGAGEKVELSDDEAEIPRCFVRWFADVALEYMIDLCWLVSGCCVGVEVHILEDLTHQLVLLQNNRPISFCGAVHAEEGGRIAFVLDAVSSDLEITEDLLGPIRMVLSTYTSMRTVPRKNTQWSTVLRSNPRSSRPFQR